MSQLVPFPEFGASFPLGEPEPFPENKSSFFGTSIHGPSVAAEAEPEPEGYGEPEPEPEPANIREVMNVVAGFAGALGLLIMIENIIVLLTLIKGKPKQRRSLTYLIGNLAVSDFVAGFHLVWFLCIDYFVIKNKPIMYIIVMCSLWLVTIVVSVIGLFNFAIFRLKLARSQESYKLSKRTAILSIIISWLLAVLLLVVPPLVGWNCSKCSDRQSCQQHCSQLLYPFTKNYVLLLAVLVVAAILGLFTTYVWMLQAVHNKVCKLKKKGTIKRKQKQMLLSVLIILLLFTICILPIAVCLFLDYTSEEYNLLLAKAFPVLVVISFINSACNPFIYIWRLPHMKSALWRLMGYKGMMPENSSFKDMVIWKISTKHRRRKESRSPSKSKCVSESSDKLSRKMTSVDTMASVNRI